MYVLCLLNRSQYGPAAEARRWNARAWPGNSLDCTCIKDVDRERKTFKLNIQAYSFNILLNKIGKNIWLAKLEACAHNTVGSMLVSSPVFHIY